MLHEPIRADAVPLVVDLDGSLITSDIAMEALVTASTRSARSFMTAVFLLIFASKAKLKAWLARRHPVDPADLVYRPTVLKLIEDARRAKRPIILASAAHRRNVARVAKHLGVFDQIVASTNRRNLRGPEKLSAIVTHLKGQPFDYVGDAGADRVIWAAAHVAYTTNSATGSDREYRLVPRPRLPRSLIRAIRPHQWAKNALVFLPLVTSGSLADLRDWAATCLAFVCLCAAASSVYLLNDVLDAGSDRQHATKCRRPIAAGELSIPVALILSALLAVTSLLLAGWTLPGQALVAVGAYLLLTVAYSVRIKSAMIADVLTLAALYTMRLIVGAAAISVVPSMWLLMFSIFFFLSLGYLKRFIELDRSTLSPDKLLLGRGYVGGDALVIAMSGMAAGMVSILVILLFAAEMGRTGQYSNPDVLWLCAIPLIYWFNRVWVMAGRGQVNGDPVAFALKDGRSIATGVGLACLVLWAKYGSSVSSAIS